MRFPSSTLAGWFAATFASTALAGGGFADKPGGGINDPVIRVSASIGPNQGAQVSLDPAQANAGYRFDATTGTFRLASTPPLLPGAANNANQFIRIDFPFALDKKKVRKSLMKLSPDTAATSYLTPNIEITDQNGNHIPGIPLIAGKSVSGAKLSNSPGFPTWLDTAGKNLLTNKKSFVYVATLPTDTDVASVAAFGGTPGDPQTIPSSITEIRIRVNEVNKITINGYWVIKIDDGTGKPRTGGVPLALVDITAKSPVSPAAVVNGNPVAESYSRYVVEFSEPVVPWSVGFSAASVESFNSGNPLIPMSYNGNSAPVPNPFNLSIPYIPTFVMRATPNGKQFFAVPFDVRPINPNNMAEYVVDSIMDLAGNLDLTLGPIPATLNPHPSIQNASVAVTSLHNEAYDAIANSTRVFHTNSGKAFTNAPVAPAAIYYTRLSGSGMGAINLNGEGFETNDPATSKVLLFTNNLQMCACTTSIALPGSYLKGCNPNVFGDGGFADQNGNTVPPTAAIGLGANPAGHMGGATPVPGVNEGSTGSTANKGNPFGIYPSGFETVVRNSTGDARLAKSPVVGSVGDVQVGDFLDTLFFDTDNPFAANAFHTSATLSFWLGVSQSMNRNSISDPPVPNPPPMRVPVGLAPLDVAFSKQDLLKPAFVLENAEVFTNSSQIACPPTFDHLPIHVLPNANPLLNDRLPSFAQNGPSLASFGLPVTYSARQQIGNFLYVTDRNTGDVKVLNSNNFSLIAKISTPDPEGLGISPDLKRLYVSNYGDDTVSIIGTDPLAAFFHQEINRLKVGNGPRAVSVQPDNEDVFVANYLGNTVSILDPKTQTVRKTLTDGVKRPWDVVLSPRLINTGWVSGIYFGYIGCQQTGEILLYESGPSGATGIGADSIRWKVANNGPFSQLRGMTYDPGTYAGSSTGLPTGVYATHRDAQTGLAMISRVAFTAQLPNTGPLPAVPLPSSVQNAPGTIQRQFSVVGTWGGPLVPLAQRLNHGGQDQAPYDVTLSDFNTGEFFSSAPQLPETNIGALSSTLSLAAFGPNSKSPLRSLGGTPIQTWIPDRMYVSFPGDDRIEVLDPGASGTKLNTINGVPNVGALTSYFEQ
jgi:YVTN family beta-propeller protein